MMNPGAPMGQDNQWLMQLLNALFGSQRPMGAPMGGMPPGIQTGMPSGSMAGGFPPEPKMGMPQPGTMDRTTPPSQGPVTPGQGPWKMPTLPKTGY